VGRLKSAFYRVIGKYSMLREYGVRVESSNVSFVKYDDDNDMLYITYKGFRQYAYPNSDFQDFENIMQAPSKGKWVWDNLRRKNRDYIRLT